MIMSSLVSWLLWFVLSIYVYFNFRPLTITHPTQTLQDYNFTMGVIVEGMGWSWKSEDNSCICVYL
jgi:hypothetical protein